MTPITTPTTVLSPGNLWWPQTSAVRLPYAGGHHSQTTLPSPEQRVERLPAYAPELNPVEVLWSNLKGGELANRCDDIIDATVAAATTGVERVRSNQQLLFAFLAKSGLSI